MRHRRGSQWTLDKVIGLILNVAKYKSLRGTSFIPLPIKLRARNAIVNVQVFLGNIISITHREEAAQSVLKYIQYVEELDFSSIELPLQMKNLSNFKNKSEILVNVFGHEKGKVNP